MALTRQEILDKIGQYEKGLSNPKLPDATKAAMVNKIEALKRDAEALEEKIEKKEDKKEQEEKKSIADLKAKLAQYEKGLSNPKLPEATKSSMKKMIAKIEQDIKEQEKEVKEDKKESEQEKKEVKKAIQEVEKVAKRKTPIKRAPIAPKIKIQEKKREVKQEKRQGKIKQIMTDLEKLVEKNKQLREKYKGKGVDLEKDAGRSAKPFGYRFRGKHDYRVPTEAQVKSGLKRGTIDYEARPNRSDKYPAGYKGSIKLEDGGMMAKGGMTPAKAKKRLEEIRKELRKESLSYGEIAELESLKKYIDKNDVELLEAAGVPEHAKGGTIHSKKKDAQRFAKPRGWRWKNEAVTDGIIKKASLSKTPSLKMRKEYPDYVAYEDRVSKSDKKPSRKYKSL
jgi:hypothetical protein